MSKLSFIKKNLLFIIPIIVALALIIFFCVRWYIASKTPYRDSTMYESEYDMVPKTYGVNEYANVLISDEQMAKIYLNDYINNIIYDIDSSYYLLDEQYRNAKFRNLNNYKSYIYNLKYTSYNVSKYYKKESDGYVIYGVYDQNGNFFAFKTKGVMQYSVFLDEDTVEIW